MVKFQYNNNLRRIFAMAMKRCEADLHFYDPDKHPTCPYCRDQAGEIDSTRGISERGRSDFGYETGSTVGIEEKKDIKPKHATELKDRIPDSDGATIGFFKKKAGFEPVVGWLVCTEGGSKGKDYRIKPGINEIGRDDTQDVQIVITGDSIISRRDHAEIEYDPDENAFYLIRKKNPAVKLNGKAVRQPAMLNAHDVIQFGESVFIFVPLCTENFKWVIDS
jgi:hypothetical protein